MRVVVTGDAGFIGRHLVHELISAGHTVTGVDARPCTDIPRGASHETCDILDPEKLTEVVKRAKAQALVHLAARTDLLEREDIRGYAANVSGTENVISAIRLSGSIDRAIFVSTQLVTVPGKRPRGPDECEPETLYGRSKLMMEDRIWALGTDGFAWCIVRPTTIWGPGMNAHYQRFFRLLKHGFYFHAGRKLLYKSYGYVKNTAFELRRLMEADPELLRGRVFYLADYEPVALQEWIDAFALELGAPPVRTLPIWLLQAAARCGDLLGRAGWRGCPFNSFRLRNILSEYQYDLADLRGICGSLPYSVTQGIRETTAWLAATWARSGDKD
jgi:GlcNAc-P-P-Und epimerase